MDERFLNCYCQDGDDLFSLDCYERRNVNVIHQRRIKMAINAVTQLKLKILALFNFWQRTYMQKKDVF